MSLSVTISKKLSLMAFPYNVYYPSPAGGRTEIRHGKFFTDGEGNFEISFEAVPDKGVSKESRPIFNFSIDVMISDVIFRTIKLL